MVDMSSGLKKNIKDIDMSLNKIYSDYLTKFRVCDSVITDRGVKIPTITGQVGMVDSVSQNGYRYQTNFWDIILGNQAIQDTINSRHMLGMIEHPTDDMVFMATPYEDASHVVMKAWVQDHQPFATFGLLNNPHGNAIKALLDVGCQPGVSTRGLGSFGQDSVSQFVDSTGYTLLTWDLVRNPNFATLAMSPVTDSLRANPVFKELVEAHALKDSADDHYNADSLRSEMIAMIDTLLKKYNIR